MAKPKAMNLDQFLGHKPSSGGGGQFLKSWKKRPDAAINVALHTQAGFVALWQHPLPRINTWTDKEGKEHVGLWGGNWNCLEAERVLKDQYKRDKETGDRKVPPCICPECKLIEKIREMVVAGELEFTQPIFHWEVDGSDPITLHAGGIYNAFGKKDLDDKLKAEMKRAKIWASEAWNENCYAKCNYVLIVVDVDNPGEGVQIANERTLLGDKLKECIAAQMVALGEDDGNPIKNPYVLRWIHLPKEEEFGKKYKVIAMPKIAITDEVRRLIIDEAPPDISGVIKPGSPSLLRAQLEEHALVEFPPEWWDELFGDAVAAEEKEKGEEDGDDEDSAPPQAPASISGGVSPNDEPPPEDDDGFECDKCKGMMASTDYTCPHCGAEYDRKTGELLPEKPKEEPKPKPRSRSQAKADAAPKEEPKPKETAKRSVAGKGYPANLKDRIPF